MKFDRYLALVFLRTGLYRIVELSPDKAHKLQNFIFHGHKYHWNTEHIHRLIGWFPWQNPTYNPIRFLVQWLQRRYTSVAVLFFTEPIDPLHGVEIGIEPMSLSNYVVKGYDRVSPTLFRGTIASPLYKKYEKSTHFGSAATVKWMTVAIIVFVAIIALLYLTGVLDV